MGRGGAPKALASILGFGSLALLAACATASLESQTKVQDQRLARIYFLRESTLLYVGGTPYIKVNDQEVGRVANGSYFFVDRAPGTYTVTLETPFSPGRYKADVSVRPSATYYVKVSPRAEHYFVGVAAGMVGQLIEASVSENSGAFSLTPLDQQAGAALLQKLEK